MTPSLYIGPDPPSGPCLDPKWEGGVGGGGGCRGGRTPVASETCLAAFCFGSGQLLPGAVSALSKLDSSLGGSTNRGACCCELVTHDYAIQAVISALPYPSNVPHLVRSIKAPPYLLSLLRPCSLVPSIQASPRHV